MLDEPFSQVMPVHVDTIKNIIKVEKMKKIGVERLIEVGPGKVLAGLTRRIDKSLSGSAIIDVATLKSTIEEIS